MDITFLAPCKDLSGGIKVISIYGNKLIELGHNVNVVYPKKKMSFKQRIKFNIKSMFKNEKNHLDYFKGKLIAVDSISIDTVPDADILIATAWETAEWANALPNSKGEKFYFIQGYEVWNGQHDKVHKTLNYPFKKITVSSWLKQKVYEITGDESIEMVPNGCDIQISEEEKSITGRTYDVGMIYSAIPNKGSKDGLKTFNILAEKNLNMKFVMFGTDEPAGNLPPNTDFFLKPDQEKIKNIYKNTKIWIVCSYEEGFCLPCLEAMAAGCAVVSTDNKGVRDIITDSVNGFIVSPGHTEEIVNKVETLFKNPNLFNEFQNFGFEKSKLFDWNLSAAKFNKILLEQKVNTFELMKL